MKGYPRKGVPPFTSRAAGGSHYDGSGAPLSPRKVEKTMMKLNYPSHNKPKKTAKLQKELNGY